MKHHKVSIGLLIVVLILAVYAIANPFVTTATVVEPIPEFGVPGVKQMTEEPNVIVLARAGRAFIIAGIAFIIERVRMKEKDEA